MKRIIILFLLSVTMTTAFAQCGIENKAFKSGEFVGYDLYFNWKFATQLYRYESCPAVLSEGRS